MKLTMQTRRFTPAQARELMRLHCANYGGADKYASARHRQSIDAYKAAMLAGQWNPLAPEHMRPRAVLLFLAADSYPAFHEGKHRMQALSELDGQVDGVDFLCLDGVPDSLKRLVQKEIEANEAGRQKPYRDIIAGMLTRDYTGGQAHTGEIDTVKTVTQKDFDAKAREIGKHYTGRERWQYFRRAGELVDLVGVYSPADVLETGTMGVQTVPGCDTLDYGEQWRFAGRKPKYLHDMRLTPWPIPDRRYRVLIALRVWQHLGAHQRACFHEARRVADNLIIVCPTVDKLGYGVTLKQWTAWNNETPPEVWENIPTRPGDTHNHIMLFKGGV